MGKQPRPTFSGPTGVIVLPGQAVDVTETFDNLNPNVPAEAFVDLGDGRGPQSTPIQRDGGGSLSGSIFVHLDHAPSFGEVGPHVTLYDMTLVNYPYTTREPAAQTGFGVPVWSVSLGDGTNNATLAASADGTRNLQPLTVSFPHDWGEAFDITLTTTNAREDLVWDTLTPGPGDVPVLGAGTTSYTFRSDPNSTANSNWHVFYVGATTGDTAYDCLSYSFTATEDAAASVQPPPPYQFLPLPTSAATSNAASNIEMRFETAKDGNSQPILTDNNPASVAAGSSSSSSSSDPTPPVASLTKVDLIYPSELVGQVPITFVTDAAHLRFWSSASEGSLIVGGPKRGITFSTGNAPTTLYADLTDRPGDVIGETTFTCGNSHSTARAMGTSISIDSLAEGDDSATVPVPSSADSIATAQADGAEDPPQAYATVHLNLPTTLAAGTTVTLTLDASVAQDVNLYDGVPGDPASNLILGRDASAASITWTVGGGSPPPEAVYGVAFAASSFDATFFTMTVTAPASPSSAPATQPATRSVVATQPAVVPPSGFLAAFDGTWDFANDSERAGENPPWPSGTLIAEFKNGYKSGRNSSNIAYERGVGNGEEHTVIGHLLHGGLANFEAGGKVKDALDQAIAFYSIKVNRTVPLDIIGLSTGAFEATAFANTIERGIHVPWLPKNQLYFPWIRFVGLVSPVRTNLDLLPIPALLNLIWPWSNKLPSHVHAGALFEALYHNDGDCLKEVYDSWAAQLGTDQAKAVANPDDLDTLNAVDRDERIMSGIGGQWVLDHTLFNQSSITLADGSSPSTQFYNDTHGGIAVNPQTYQDMVAAAKQLGVPVTNLIS